MSKRILVVDDDQPIRKMVCRVLSLGNPSLELLQAGSGPEALELLGRESFDLVIVDFMMPEMNGLEVVRSLRQNEEWRHLPVIVLTARSELAGFEELPEPEANHLAKKPFEPDQLLELIGSILGVPFDV